jgi:ribosomal protein S3AE
MKVDFDVLTGLIRVKGFTKERFDDGVVDIYTKDPYLVRIDEDKFTVIRALGCGEPYIKYEIVEGLEKTLNYEKVAEFISKEC